MREIIREHYEENFNLYVKRFDGRAGGVMNAEDIVQEAYTRALRYSDSFKPDIHEFGPWFGTILNNCFKDFKAAERPTGPPAEEEGGETADDLHYQRTQVKAITDAIEMFDQPRRDILYLWYIKQYSRADIHKVMDVSKNTIKTVVRRFKLQMREAHLEDG